MVPRFLKRTAQWSFGVRWINRVFEKNKKYSPLFTLKHAVLFFVLCTFVLAWPDVFLGTAQTQPTDTVAVDLGVSKVQNLALDLARSRSIATHQLSSNESGFISLFNGRDLTGWQGSGWTVEDGLLICHGGFLTCSNRQFTNFIIRFEVKLSSGANNGLNFRSKNSLWNEIQIIDETHPAYATIHDYQAHGSLYGVVAARRGFCKPLGEWNIHELIANGSHIQVTLNGTKIVDADIGNLDLDNCKDGTAHPGLRNASGDLGWLGHPNAKEKKSPVYFRNIRLKQLP